MKINAACAVIAALALAAAPAAAQIAPTLPSDTLGGKRLAPEANVPSGIVAPTLPSDTLDAGACLRRDTIAVRIVQSTPRREREANDTTATVAANSLVRCADGSEARTYRKGNSR